MHRMIARAGVVACLVSTGVPVAQARHETRAIESDSPLETIIVVGTPHDTEVDTVTVEPVLEGRLSTLDDLFRGTPGVVLEPVFGGIDHPRFSIRGSGLQRGTQPAGRGIELRLDGLPMNYADTSFDFVEWIDPLFFDTVSVLRGGRGAQAGATALGGIVDFSSRSGEGPVGGLARAEVGAFGYRRGQFAIEGGDRVRGFATLTRFGQEGFREHNAQQATRALARVEADLSDRVSGRASLLWSDSELELPGPQTLAQIEAGSRDAQPFNVGGVGDWRRFSERVRGAAGLTYLDPAQRADIDVGYMSTDVSFRRRDVQREDNEDLALSARYRRFLGSTPDAAVVGANVVFQHGERRQRQFFNGGGTPPTFTGSAGALWADNLLRSTRLSIQGIAELPLTERVDLELTAGWNRHTRDISDRFPVRAARPAAELDAEYSDFTGLALLSFALTPDLETFAGVSVVSEPPTYDLLLINVSGTPGPGNALLIGADPRRPETRSLDAQRALTAEAGLRGRLGPLGIDFTLYRGWIDNEVVSTVDFVTQNVTSVGNADDTRRLGIEFALNTRLASDLLSAGDSVSLSTDWTWTRARFAGDQRFGDNRLPIVVEHLLEGRLIYRHSAGFSAEAFATVVPDGGFVDYANTLRADGYHVLGLRVSYETERWLAFVEGRNVTDANYPSTVIAARNNVAGMDVPAFAPGEPAALTAGIQLRF